ncbi:MAG: hypothetical protein KF760_09565 [Candidatus Eremiobacteraeota bacterium]|nr:hypothetical protein [Candidatus Eremiobacteraeota bacterium]MCW5866277.1 hypothetical protein [Candidatus Eremiobacteraeota bacterium]
MTKLQAPAGPQIPKTTLRSAAPPSESETPPPADGDSLELGVHKTVSQHLGNAGFGISSVAAFGDGLNALMNTAAQIPGSELVPGLNVGVAAVEGYNSIKKLREHEPIVAATSAGNALGTMGTFLGQVAAGHALVGWQVGSSTAVLGVGAGFGVLAGSLGIAAGVAEIKKGHETHSARTSAMGCLDISSGVVSLTGAAAMAGGAAPLGVGLLMLANLVDLAGIGVDYLWKKWTRPKQTHVDY